MARRIIRAAEAARLDSGQPYRIQPASYSALQHARVLRLVRVERMVAGRRRQVVLVEPRPQRRPELGGVGQVGHPASGLPIACGRPESWSPLRRMKVMARVFSRQPSSVRT